MLARPAIKHNAKEVTNQLLGEPAVRLEPEEPPGKLDHAAVHPRLVRIEQGFFRIVSFQCHQVI